MARSARAGARGRSHSRGGLERRDDAHGRAAAVGAAKGSFKLIDCGGKTGWQLVDVPPMGKKQKENADKVLLVDDLIATGGTMGAGVRLMKRVGACIVECAVIIELPGLGGRKKKEFEGIPVHTLLEIDVL